MPSSEEPEKNGQERQAFLVVTGSSAGGIDALSSFVSNLPANFSVPIVIAQHLAPQHESHLASILAQNTTMQVRTIEGEVQIEPGTVYVVPPNRDV
jgi:two-component system, chemotaxis family, CheB/CheR fusion protein